MGHVVGHFIERGFGDAVDEVADVFLGGPKADVNDDEAAAAERHLPGGVAGDNEGGGRRCRSWTPAVQGLLPERRLGELSVFEHAARQPPQAD